MSEREHEMIARLLAPLSAGLAGAFGLKDDAACLLPPDGESFVVTLDTSLAGRHFVFDGTPEAAWRAARKSLAVNVSDLVAKGARPYCYFLSLELPADHEPWLDAFVAGLAAAQSEWGLKLAGGDTVSGSAQLGVSITALGTVPLKGTGAMAAMVRRSTARADDVLVVSGSIGDAWAGLHLLRSAEAVADGTEIPSWQSALSTGARERLIRRSRTPEPRLGLIEAIRTHASAALDVSDGLAIDAARLGAASGLAVQIEAAKVPVDRELSTQLGSGHLALTDLLAGGDDYEVLAAVPPDRLEAFICAGGHCGVALTPIGRLCEGKGLAVFGADGEEIVLTRLGWDHFDG